jgi:preprotein translocase subunit SecF
MTTTEPQVTPPPASAEPHHGFFSRLSTGTGAFNVLGPRKIYYWVGIVLVVLSILLIVFRGFNLGIDFAGGTRLTFAIPAGETISTQQVADVFNQATGVSPDSVQTIGRQAAENIQITSSALDVGQITAARAALAAAFGLDATGVSDSAVSETWGSEVSTQALISVIVFLIAVAIFIWIRYDRRGALAAVTSTIQVMIITAGVYSLVGFEVTPATVIGLLTILGFSLYDTVVVFDKVQENAKGLTSLTRRTYTESANLAVNQTLMRSINTSLIALLPVAGLLFAGVVILGSGTLKDLALVQLVGMLVGAYSSLFVAVPLAVDLRLRDPAIKAHTARVVAKRKAEGLIVDAVGDPVSRVIDPTRVVKPAVGRPAQVRPVVAGMKPGQAPKPGVRPARPSKTVPRVTATPDTTTDEAATEWLSGALTPASNIDAGPSAPESAEVAETTSPGSDVSTAAATSGSKPAAKSAPAKPSGKNARPTGKRGR